jgi:hypothetical protein
MLIGMVIFLSGGPRLLAGPLQAGAARVDITPPTGYPMWGYAVRHDAPSVGVRDPLYARAVVLAVGESRIAIVSLDLGRAPTRASVDAIRRRTKAAVGIEHLFLVASHTHHGPVVELDNWPKEGKPYVRQLEDRLVRAITAAAKDVRPARLGVVRETTDLNRNRHSKKKDKPRDDTLTVVRIDDAAGKPITHLVNFAAHPVMLDARLREFSPAFPGFMAARVEKELGGQCLFLQGAAGDLSPDPHGRRTPEQFGAMLADAVLQCSKRAKCDLSEPAALAARERDFTFGKRVDLGNPLVRAAYSLAFFPALIDFYEREYRDGIRPHLTTALLDKRIALVGVSGEFFGSHAVHLRRRAPVEHLLFLGYCNDYHQYFPTIEAAAEGGYGADAQVSPVELGAGERMMDAALMDLLEMQGKVRRADVPAARTR